VRATFVPNEPRYHTGKGQDGHDRQTSGFIQTLLEQVWQPVCATIERYTLAAEQHSDASFLCRDGYCALSKTRYRERTMGYHVA